MGLVDWTNIYPPGSGGKSNKEHILKLVAGKKYKIRPLNKPIAIYRYYVTRNGQTRSAITADPTKCIIHQKFPNEEPKLRYAINVIDRSDNKIKVLEAPVTVFRAMKTWADETGKNPGGAEGCDFSITVEVPANGDKKLTKYNCIPLTQTPLTEPELAMARAERHDLEKMFAPTDQTKIESILFPPDTGNKQAQTVSQGSVATQQTTTEEDAFGF